MYRMVSSDAAMYWASQFSVTDQLVVFGFDAESSSSADLIGAIRQRAAAISDLHLDVQPVPGNLDFPRWVPTHVRPDAIVVGATSIDWNECLVHLAALSSHSLSADGQLWRIVIFSDVSGVPGVSGPGTVVVLHISHALGDGRRATAIARALFGAHPPVLTDEPPTLGDRRLAAAASAALFGVQLATATVRGLAGWAAQSLSGQPETPPGRGPVPATSVNTGPGHGREFATLTVHADRVRIGGASVTASVLARIAKVLPNAIGAPAAQACVELTVAFAHQESEPARNRFQTVGIGLHAEEVGRAARAAAIGTEIAAARARVWARAATQRADPAPPVLAAAAARLAATAGTPSLVSGWTVVSSVNRGPDDLHLLGGRVRMTAGFPALSATHGLTHGIHGIGETVTISVAASDAVAPRLRGYLAALAETFD